MLFKGCFHVFFFTSLHPQHRYVNQLRRDYFNENIFFMRDLYFDFQRSGPTSSSFRPTRFYTKCDYLPLHLNWYVSNIEGTTIKDGIKNHYCAENTLL